MTNLNPIPRSVISSRIRRTSDAVEKSPILKLSTSFSGELPVVRPLALTFLPHRRLLPEKSRVVFVEVITFFLLFWCKRCAFYHWEWVVPEWITHPNSNWNKAHKLSPQAAIYGTQNTKDHNLVRATSFPTDGNRDRAITGRLYVFASDHQ